MRHRTFFFYHHHTELCFKIKHSINQLDIKSINTIHNIIYFLYTVFLQKYNIFIELLQPLLLS